MPTPIQTLYEAAKERKSHGIKVMSIDFVLSMIEREQNFYRLPSKSRLETLEVDARQSV